MQNRCKVMELRKARESELSCVLCLYKSVIGREFCVWNEFYPDEEEIQGDFKVGNLYVLTEDGEIVGAISVVPKNELDGYDCFKEKEAAELARVVISPSRQGRGLARTMVLRMLDMLRRDGVKSVHMSVAVKNLPALKTYEKCGFSICGNAFMYGGEYYLAEKIL